MEWELLCSVLYILLDTCLARSSTSTNNERSQPPLLPISNPHSKLQWVRVLSTISPVIFLIRRKKNPPTQGSLFLLGDITTILNLILKSCHIIIALLHNTVWSKYHKTALIGTLTCFIYTFCQWKSFVFRTKRINKTCQCTN